MGRLGRCFGDAFVVCFANVASRGGQDAIWEGLGSILEVFGRHFGDVLATCWWPLGSKCENYERKPALKAKSDS